MMENILHNKNISKRKATACPHSFPICADSTVVDIVIMIKTKFLTIGLIISLLLSLSGCSSNVVPTLNADNIAASSNDSDNGDVPSDKNRSGESGISDQVNSGISKTNYTRTETSYSSSGELYYWREFRYGSDGKLESITSYRADGSESGHVDITYDVHGTQLSEFATKSISVSFLSNGLPSPVVDETTGSVFLTNQYECEYDTNGNIILKKSETVSEKNEYDDTGKCITTYRSYPSGFLVNSYEYDTTGNLISETGYNENDDLISRILHQYDAEGHETVQESYSYANSEATLRNRIEFEYTDRGDLSKIRRYSYDMFSEPVETRHTVYYYDEQGAFIAQEEYYAIDGLEVLFERVECTYE